MTPPDKPKQRQLLLWRHAKSDWSNPDLQDHDRPLVPRGQKAAKRMAKWFIQQDLKPEQVLCSTSVRTRQTLDYFTSLTAIDCEFKPSLYHAEPAGLMQEIAQADNAFQSLMLVGHNPGFEDLVLMLNAQGDNPPITSEKVMPTGALAIFQFNGDWKSITTARCQLQAIIRPRELVNIR